MTAPVWIRGILSDHYGVPVDSVTYLHRRRGGAGALREAEARPAAGHPRRADRPDADAVGDARERRDRRAVHGAHAVDVLTPAAATCGGCSTTSRQVEQHVLPRHRHLSDHAHGRDPARGVRGQPLDRAVAVQGVRRGAAAHLRRPLRHRGAQGDAAVADGARRGGARADGRRLLAVRLRAQPRRRSRRSCAITTSRACRSGVLEPEELFAPETLESFKI